MDPEKIEQQRQLYGEPVGDLVRRISTRVGVTQTGVARVIGLSPAMLSQLMSGQRLKIGNPLVVSRLQALLALAEDAPDLTQQELATRLDEIRDSRVPLTTSQRRLPEASQALLVARVLRAVASGRELDLAAQSLADVSPGLAEVIRVYGTGSREEAERHLASIQHLL